MSMTVNHNRYNNYEYALETFYGKELFEPKQNSKIISLMNEKETTYCIYIVAVPKVKWYSVFANFRSFSARCKYCRKVRKPKSFVELMGGTLNEIPLKSVLLHINGTKQITQNIG